MDMDSEPTKASPIPRSDHDIFSEMHLKTVEVAIKRGLQYGRIEGFLIGIIVAFFLSAIVMYSLMK